MTLALPGSCGLFSTLQEAFQHSNMHRCIRLHKATHDFLDDFWWLAATLHQHPTQMREIIPGHPTYIGSCNASGQGMGGVWFPTDSQQPTMLWHTPFPAKLRQQLVSVTNPTGSITNSDLELLGAIAHQAVLAACHPIAETTNALLNDNTAAIHWLRRGSITSTKAAAYLLRLQALHGRHHCYLTTYDYIPSPANHMADDCSRLWHLSDDALLTHFHSQYPQASGWTLCPLPSAMTSALISTLQQQQPEPASYLPTPLPPIGTGPSGPPSAAASKSIPTSLTWTLNPSTSSESSPSVTEMAPLPHAVDRSSLALWRVPSVWWARHWPYCGPRIPSSLF